MDLNLKIEIFPAPPWWLAVPGIAVAAPLSMLTAHYAPVWTRGIAWGIIFGYASAKVTTWLWRRRFRP